MRSIYRLDGGNGIDFFSSRAEAERAVEAIPKDWGRAIGSRRPSVTEVKLFDSVSEWQSYTGMGRVAT